MLKVKLTEIKNQLTKEQIEAIEQCHNACFYAAMCDDYDKGEREEKSAIEKLKTYFTDLSNFIGDFYNGNDTLIFNNEVR